jgi:hypothetical protein
MSEQAAFETRAVLEHGRSRTSRLAQLVPVIALAATAWAGLSGAPPGQGSGVQDADLPRQPASAGAQASVVVADGLRAARPPGQVLGLEVRKLEEIEPRRIGPDEVVALAGWYVATAITDCPPLAAIYREGSLPEVRGDVDSWAFCDRYGVLFASEPHRTSREPTNDVGGNPTRGAGLSAVAVTLVIGVVVPPRLEIIGADATLVVVVGRFESNGSCAARTACPRQLVVDHVAWADG